jgi:hypothetical protein
MRPKGARGLVKLSVILLELLLVGTHTPVAATNLISDIMKIANRGIAIILPKLMLTLMAILLTRNDDELSLLERIDVLHSPFRVVLRLVTTKVDLMRKIRRKLPFPLPLHRYA